MIESLTSVIITVLVPMTLSRTIDILRAKKRIKLAWIITGVMHIAFVSYLYLHFHADPHLIVAATILLFTVQGGWSWLGNKSKTAAE